MLRGDIAERAREVSRQNCAAREVRIIRGAVSPDHIHILVGAPPQLSPSKLVPFIKGRSSRRSQQGFPALRKGSEGNTCARRGRVAGITLSTQRWDEGIEGFRITAAREPWAGSEPGTSSGG